MFGKYITVTQTDGVTLASSSLEYYSKDHLGSMVAITNDSGAVIQRLSYDVWGKRRYPNGAADPNGLLNNPDMYHGFTGHEMLDDVGLIHMNGRLYDPAMGRFLSADPHIQDPLSLQSYNRYSYVWNNPLSSTDPSGYWKVFGINITPRMVISIAVAVYAPQFIGNFGAGFASGLVSSNGDLKAGLISGLTANAFGGLHNMPLNNFGDYAMKIGAHGAVGGISNVLQGGDFKSGFMSSAFTQAASLSGAFDGIESRIGNAVAAAVVGGTASVLGGGKFQNGAVTGAFSRLFNDLKCDADKCYGDKPTKSEIDEHWRNGGGKPVDVNGKNVDLSYIPTENFPEVGQKGAIGSKLGVALGIGDGRIYGSLTATRISALQVTLSPDSYDFQPHAGPGTTVRNIETYAGFYSASRGGTQVGTDFKINFVGPTPVP